jgi:calcineurin-like phosphoesterase family protein
VESRLPDHGAVLIHGHTHSTGSPVSRSKSGTLQILVGVDAWGFRPVHSEEVAEIIRQEAA